MRLLTSILLVGYGLALTGGAADAVPLKPWETGALNVESGVLW